jgi:acyl carrier protein
MSSPELAVDEQAVLADLTEMIATVLADIGALDTEVTLATTFRDDLDLESIDLVALGGLLGERYGDRVNFAEFVADLELDEIIALTVGDLVEYVLVSLRAEG